MGRTYSKNVGQQVDQTLHRVATKEREEIKRTTKQKMARRHSKEGGNHLEQESNRQKTMEDIDGGLFVGCLTSQQHASVSQGRICTDNFTCYHTEMEAADRTFHLTQSQYTDTGPTSPSADPISPGAWQGSHWSANFEVTGMTRPRKNPGASRIRTRDLPLSRRTPYH